MGRIQARAIVQSAPSATESVHPSSQPMAPVPCSTRLADQRIPACTSTVTRSATIVASGLAFCSDAMRRSLPRAAWAYYDVADGMDGMEYEEGVKEQLDEALREAESEGDAGGILFIASDGRSVFKGMHAPDGAARRDAESPELIRAARDRTYIAIYPSDALRSVVGGLEDAHPGDEEGQRTGWAEWMEGQVAMLSRLVEERPPDRWDSP